MSWCNDAIHTVWCGVLYCGVVLTDSVTDARLWSTSSTTFTSAHFTSFTRSGGHSARQLQTAALYWQVCPCHVTLAKQTVSALR